MKAPRWQRALVRAPDFNALGELWVKIEHPQKRWAGLSYVTHLKWRGTSPCYAKAERAELMARGPGDFRFRQPKREDADDWIDRHQVDEPAGGSE